jgi:5'-3' exonuclease
MLLKVIRDHAPDYVVVVFDAPGKTFRDDLFAEYKAHRPDMPEELAPQIPCIHKIVEGFRLGRIALEGYEADDLIGTLVERLRGNLLEMVIVSGDKDLLQLVGEGITMLDTMKDVTYGPAEVVQRFGVPPKVVSAGGSRATRRTTSVPGSAKDGFELIRGLDRSRRSSPGG